LGSGGQEYGIGLYLDRGTHAKMHAARTPEAAAQVRKGLSTIAVTFDPEPAFAAEAIGALTGMPFVPVALFVDKGRMRPVEGKHLVVLAACLRAAASSDGIAEVRVAKSRARVTLTTEGA